jgi:glyoxylase-like metal-dependent hydrolase (beta-lactamase superfamily II)
MCPDFAHRSGPEIRIVTAGAFPSNCYIGTTAGERDCFLVDPGLGGSAIDEALSLLQLEPRYVFCTHGHFDHAGSAAFFQKKYGAQVLMHVDDMKTLRSSNFLLMALKIPTRIELPEVTPVEGADFSLPLGGAELRYRHAPGHTPGSCVIEYGSSVFTGDTIYRSGVGLSQLPGEDTARLRASILALWDTIPGSATLYPGHGKPASFDSIRSGNTALRDFLGLPHTGGSAPR